MKKIHHILEYICEEFFSIISISIIKIISKSSRPNEIDPLSVFNVEINITIIIYNIT